MSTTTDTETVQSAPRCPYKWVWFTTAKNGKRMAWGWGTRSHRAFRISMADAELWIATEATVRIGGHPFSPDWQS